LGYVCHNTSVSLSTTRKITKKYEYHIIGLLYLTSYFDHISILFENKSHTMGPGPYLRTAPRGPGPGRQIFRGGILKKSRLKYGMREKKAVHETEI